MTPSSTLKLLALTCVIACAGGSAFGAGTVASNWKLEKNVLQADGTTKQDRLIEVLTDEEIAAGVVAWNFRFHDNKNIRGENKVVGTHTDLDFSMLDGSDGAPCKVTSIQNSTLNGTSITSVKFPRTLTSFAYQAFSGCSSLIGTINIPYVTDLPNSLFAGTAVERVIVPSLRSIQSSIFRGATGLKSMKFPYWMTTWNGSAFQHNTSARSILIHTNSAVSATADSTIKSTSGATVIRYGGMVEKDKIDWVYDNAVWNPETKIYDVQYTNVTIVALTNLTDEVGATVQIPRKLSIEGAFKNADGEVETRIVSATVTAIEVRAFKTNNGLIGKTVKIPASVTRIGRTAFPTGCFFKVKDSPHAQGLVDQLNAEHGTDAETGKLYASIDAGDGLKIIVR